MQKNLLNSVKLIRPNSSVFDRSRSRKLSCNMGRLIPVFVEDCVPGDRWKIQQEAICRLVPMVTPMMHHVNMCFHTFFVPYRLLWENYETYMSPPPGASTPAMPILNYADNWVKGGLLDHLGLPDPGAVPNFFVNAFYNSAYQFIWNEYFRDPRLQTPKTFALADGDNSSNADLFLLNNRGWNVDYFTACTPEAQAGDAVTIPLGTISGDAPVYRSTAGSAPDTTVTALTGVNPLTIIAQDNPDVAAGNVYAETDGLSLEAIAVRDWRRALKLQEFLERENVGGPRYEEQIYSMFGVAPKDSRMQRPEFITGTKTPIQISEVLQTGESSVDSPQGNMAGHGIAYANGSGGSYSVTEHGCIMTVMSVMPQTDYYQGVPRMFMKYTDRYQYFWPLFEHIGDQAVTYAELQIQHASPFSTFGYNPRYTEYKVAHNELSGDMRDDYLNWTLARNLVPTVALNSDFMTCDPSYRVFAVTDETVDHLIILVSNKAFARRLMSKYSSPHL